MNDSWFDEYMFEIAARKEYLPAELQAALGPEPIVLPPWDPMGALARSGQLRTSRTTARPNRTARVLSASRSSLCMHDDVDAMAIVDG